MTIGFGVKTKEVKGGLIFGASCPDCNTAALRNAGTIKVIQVLGLPLFPVGSCCQIACGKCGAIFKLKQASEDVRLKANPVITPKNLLLSSWGLPVLLIVILVLLYASSARA